ncbi:hypothetical protein KCP77_09725 [Salmonella enterica subsp. enterica]|nr:hypothetical protein KCP77_09725 [Salmonella enterica subsp. enterica]
MSNGAGQRRKAAKSVLPALSDYCFALSGQLSTSRDCRFAWRAVRQRRSLSDLRLAWRGPPPNEVVITALQLGNEKLTSGVATWYPTGKSS